MPSPFAGAAAGVEVANVVLDEGEAGPSLVAHAGPHHVEVLLVAGDEVVESDHGLAEAEQPLQKIGADIAGNAGDEPARGVGGELVA